MAMTLYRVRLAKQNVSRRTHEIEKMTVEQLLSEVQKLFSGASVSGDDKLVLAMYLVRDSLEKEFPDSLLLYGKRR